jgi:hypothetical protein
MEIQHFCVHKLLFVKNDSLAVYEKNHMKSLGIIIYNIFEQKLRY